MKQGVYASCFFDEIFRGLRGQIKHIFTNPDGKIVVKFLKFVLAIFYIECYNIRRTFFERSELL